MLHPVPVCDGGACDNVWGAEMRGSDEVLPAAIFFCDMRGFTTLSDTRRPEEVVRVLDGVFDRVALAAVDRWNVERAQRGEDPIGLGIALHRGDVFYGNVGAQGCLDFTVIGAVVNETSRVEALCKTLGLSLLLTDALRARLPVNDALVSVGRHTLRGVTEPVELFTAAHR
jgi:adenylate cyclase